MKFLLSVCFLYIINLSFAQETMQWVYAETETSQKGSMKNFYYYGQIPIETYIKIQNGEYKGVLLCLQNVHYIDENDRIVSYSDEIDNGTIILPTKDLIIMVGKKKLPLNEEDFPSFKRDINQEF